MTILTILFYLSEKTSPDILCESSAKQTIQIRCQDFFSENREKKKIKIVIYYKFCLALYRFTTYDNIKVLFRILCFAHVSLINDTKAFTGIVARSKLIDSYNINFKP